MSETSHTISMCPHASLWKVRPYNQDMQHSYMPCYFSIFYIYLHITFIAFHFSFYDDFFLFYNLYRGGILWGVEGGGYFWGVLLRGGLIWGEGVRA